MQYRIIPALFWTAGVLYAILSPGSGIPSLPKFPGYDKVIHFSMFFGLVFLWNRVWNAQPIKSAFWKIILINYLVFGIILAIFTEYMQMYVPDRSFDRWDIFANALGGTIGTVIYVFLYRNKSVLV
ncbi:VanZ family protein [Pleomorphovibrio marinus]|uniref:VanZ family protein n=1 Tax=Pleomorphovibrio marinus TaxID=2164132 RepID=UPI000E0B3950|nr:VanZ family protein [Pleomorphovibrio marinus]